LVKIQVLSKILYCSAILCEFIILQENLFSISQGVTQVTVGVVSF
jgi:hypothetical protein